MRTGRWSSFLRVQSFRNVHYQLVRRSSKSFVARSAVAPERQTTQAP